MASEIVSDSEAAIAVANGEPKAPGAFSGSEKAIQEDQQVVVHTSTVTNQEQAKEMTMRQVAPLVIILTGATFLQAMSSTVIIILLPSIARDVHIAEPRQQWVVSAFSLTSGSFLLLAGKLGDVYGRRILFILGNFWFTATSFGVAFSPNEICLFVMRALQGLGCAFTVATAIGIIGFTIPPGRVKTYSFSIYSGGAPVGGVLGNLLAGIVLNFTSWKVVFYILAAVSFIFGSGAIFVIPKVPVRQRTPNDPSHAFSVDWIGAFLYTSGVLLLLTGLSEGVSQGWKTPFVIAILVIAVLCISCFVYWQHFLETKSAQEPLIRISIFRTARFSFAIVILFLFASAFTNYQIYTTYFYQDYQLLSPLQTALRFVPLGIVGSLYPVYHDLNHLLTAIVSVGVGTGYALSRIRGNYILIFGLASAGIANLLFAVPIPPSSSYFAYGFPAMCLAAVGVDTVYPCLGLFTTQSLPRKDQGVAGGMFQTVGSLGRVMLLPVAAGIQSAVQKKEEDGLGERTAFLHALRAVEWLCVACIVSALLIAIFGLRNMGKIGLLKKLGNVQSASPPATDEEAQTSG